MENGQSLRFPPIRKVNLRGWPLNSITGKSLLFSDIPNDVSEWCRIKVARADWLMERSVCVQSHTRRLTFRIGGNRRLCPFSVSCGGKDLKAGNLPNKGRNFNTQTWGKIVYFLFVWLVGIGFRQNFFRVLPNFGDLVAKMSFFHYKINQKQNNFIKQCSPPVYQEAADIRDVYLYKKFAVKVGSWYTGGGGDDVL